jgi:hypothetical protein
MAKKAAQSCGFLLDGKDFTAATTPRSVLKIIEFLSALPANEIVSTKELASRIGYGVAHIASNVGMHPDLQEFRVRVRYPKHMSVWGNKKTIAELSKHQEILA